MTDDRILVESIQSPTPKMQFLKLEREPILGLSEGKEKTKREE